HRIGLALPGPEPDYRDDIGLRPVLDVLPELLPDRLEQRRGHDRLALVIAEEVDHPACCLLLGDMAHPARSERSTVSRDRPHSTGMESITHTSSAGRLVSMAMILTSQPMVAASLRSRLLYPDWPGR